MPPADAGRVVVWRLGDALLAAPLADTIEIAALLDLAALPAP